MNPVYGYSNHIAAHQQPKAEYAPVGESRTGPKRLMDKTSSKYEWNQSLKQHEKFKGCGEIDMTLACECSECGWPASGPEQAACPHCGTTNEPRCK